jgi:hypothetical protein
MTEENKQANQYRFSGYQLPMLQLDSTGANYIQISRVLRFPEYARPPLSWSRPIYREETGMDVATQRRAIHGRLYPPL